MTALTKSAINLTALRRRREKETQRQLRYLTGAITLEETINPHLIRRTMIIISAAVMVFLTWSSFAHISEVSRAYGEIVPASSTRVVQHLDGGQVEAINVTEHQLIRKGDVLFVIDGMGAGEDLAEIKAHQTSLALELERLHAFVEQRAPDFSAIDATPQAKAREMDTYASMLAAREDERSVMRQQLAQKQQSAHAAQARLSAFSKNMKVAEQQYAMLNTLKQKQLVTTPRYLDSLRQLNETEGNMSTAANEKKEAQAAIGEYSERLAMIDARYRNDSYEQLHRAEGEYAQTSERLLKLQQRADRREVRSPVDGYVKGLKVTTLGSVVQPGETLAEIVPSVDRLVADVRIRPQDVGQVNVGEKARVKISAFDFSRFGALEGKIETMSATTFTDEQGQKYYRGRISLPNPYVGDKAANRRLIPGMTVEADIITGEKTVLGYLVKPVQVAMSNALSER